MAPPVRTPRSTWIECGLDALATGGPEAVRVDALAKGLGVTRGGFYAQFASRQELMDAILDRWETTVTVDVLEQVEASGVDPRVKIRLAAELTLGGPLRPIDLAVREWSRRDRSVAERLRRVDNQRIDYLRALFSTFCADEAEVEVRSVLGFSLLIGSQFIVTDHGDRTRDEAIELAAQYLLR